MLFLIISATYLIAGSDELKTTEIQTSFKCSVYDTRDSLFQYKEDRTKIIFKINNLTGIFPYGENPNTKKNNYDSILLPQPIIDSPYYDTSDKPKKVDISKKLDYSYVPKVDYFLESDGLKFKLTPNAYIKGSQNKRLSSEIAIVSSLEQAGSLSIEQHNVEYAQVEKHDENTSGLISAVIIGMTTDEPSIGDITIYSTSYENGLKLIEKIFLGNNVKLVVKYNLLEGKVKTTKMKVYEKKFLEPLETYKLIDNKIVTVKPPMKTIEVDTLEETSTPIIKEYEIIYDKNLLQHVKAECEEKIVLKKNELIRNDLAIVLGAILGIGALLLVLKFIYNILKSKAIELKVKAVELQQRAHEYKVQKIAEDEAIRATVKKAIENDIDEAKELQELINKAVTKGDTETAQSLLSILERQKNKNGKE